jgi:Protein of unknown function (DUF2442)
MKLLHVTSATVCGPRCLRLAFDDGTRKRVDLTPLLEGPIFRAVRRPGYFAKVRLDARLGTICWPNGADLAPEALRALPALRNGHGAGSKALRSLKRVARRPRRA